MLIAIDYDNTYTRDPWLWQLLVTGAIRNGHQVALCTGRAFPPEGVHLPTYCTAGQAKRDYLAAQGLHPDVWIDDDPASILTDGV